MRIDAKHVLLSSGLPVVQGELQSIGPDWTPICMTCGESFEFPQALRESLIGTVNSSSPVIFCPKCNSGHLLADGQKAMIIGPVGAPRQERPKGLVLARVVTPDSLLADAQSGVLGQPLNVSMGDTRVLTPGDYLAMADTQPIKPIRIPGHAAFCSTCGSATEQHCPDCQKPLCLKTGCEASHVVGCPPKKRDSFV